MIKFSIFLAVLIPISLLGALFGYNRELEKHRQLLEEVIDIKTEELQLERNQESGIKNQSEDAVDTSTWKTYRNEKYGFMVRYPATFDIKETKTQYGSTGGEVVLFSELAEKNKISIEIFPQIRGELLLDAFKRINSIDPYSLEKEYGLIGNIEITKLKDIPGHVSYDEIIFFGNGWYFEITSFEENETLFKDFLNSFKFTK